MLLPIGSDGGGQLPALALDFLGGTADPRLTVSGGANGTRIDSTGTLVAANAPRFDYNPSTLSALGLLVEEARTNAIRNNTMVGASAGVQPTNWTSWIATANGVTLTTSAPLTENGVTCIDVSVSGTATVTGTAATPAFELFTTIAAVQGQTWTQSAYLRVVSGSMGGARVSLRLEERDATTPVGTQTGSDLLPTGVGITQQRFSQAFVVANATTAFLVPRLRFSTVNAEVYNFTLRIGLPQLELGAFADSPVQTSTAAVTRTADSALVTGTNFSSWFNGAAGTFVVQFDVNSTTGTRPILSLDDNSANQQIRLYASGTSVKLTVTNGSVTQADLTLGTITAGSVNKVAFAYAAADFAAVLNGGTVQTAASGTVPTVDRARLGSDQAGNVQNGHDRSLRFFPSRQPNASLVSLTT